MKIVKHHNTIGCFYNHILNALSYLTDCGRNNSMFTGDKSRQVDFSEWSVKGHTIKVYDYFTAVEAIEDIIDQGEGSSPCNPVAWDTGSKRDLSHYFLFYSVAEKHEIQVVESVTPPDDSNDDVIVDYTKVFSLQHLPATCSPKRPGQRNDMANQAATAATLQDLL